MNLTIHARPNGRAPVSSTGRRRGGVLVEFSLLALALYLVLAGMLSLGRWMAVSQAAQDTARFAAREFALFPLPAEITFDGALTDAGFRSAVYDPDQLVVDIAANPPGPALEAVFDAMPVVNRALRPLMITSNVSTPGGSRRLLHMPGALVDSPTSPTGLSVLVPRILARDANTGAESLVELAPVVEEVGPGTFPISGSGIVGLRLNVPFQSATFTAYLPPGLSSGRPIEATELGGTNEIIGPGPEGAGPYSGTFGLGRLEAFGLRARPFRRLVAAQALFRREIVL
ncbi:MAG: TadE/TadG family type IV pilus assembly protein [Planctomycetota bacterium]